MSAALPYIAGGLAGCVATCIVLPIDSLKVSLQLDRGSKAPGGPSRIVTATKNLLGGGVSTIWGGLSPALARQLVYTSSRMGLYSSLTLYMKGLSALNLSFPAKVSCAATAGALSSLLSTPLDLALTRVQANNALPLASRTPNLNPVKVLSSAWSEGGLQGVFRGASPTILRAVLLNVGMLAVGDELKQRFTLVMDPTPALFLSSVVAGVVCALLSLPADLLKTRIQSGVGEAKGMRHIAMEVHRKEGLEAFWKGSIPYIFRIAPHGVITLVLTPFFLSLLKR